ncbi:hypothetical protein SAMN04515671_4337 [Nakamurella panacisegetis]|uniref:Uncharacterized protein n=1 Tax=Nakamurella panacisegetis TaxID=1090615 RepID=A0A1H0SWZ6_9ACTN|nr:hypothetical protein [Nakamurella panacisegetis]SDP46164.1 hypothetical protein SAMN04515671_4337 [Nakamurella panacisegetis]
MYTTTMLGSGATYLRMGVVQISLANLLVILAMIVVFVLALVLPFPSSADRREVGDDRR